METLEVAGNWWLPNQPDKKVPGILTFDTLEAGRLKLIGGLRGINDIAISERMPGGATRIAITDDILKEVGRYGRIHGQCDNQADRKSTRLNSSHSDLSRMPSSA